MTISNNVKNIALTLRDNGFSCHIAGGFVRDRIMGRQSHDIDLVTDATPDQIERIFTCAHTIGKKFGVVTVAECGELFEIATLRKDAKTGDGRHPDSVEFTDSLIADAERRDFTINAMFLNPLTKERVDPFNGFDDIRGSLIRCVGNADDRFQEDHLRMLRAIRFAVTIGMIIEDETWNAIKRNAHLIRRISAERIQAELMKILAVWNADDGILMLDSCGLLEHILPEVTALSGVEQPEEFHPEGDVYNHTFKALRDAGRFSTALERLAVLLHDIGKPSCQTWNPDKGRFQFIGHDVVGAKMAETIMRRLKFSRKEIDAVVFAIRNHMKMHQFGKMRKSKRLALAHHEHFQVLHIVAMADSDWDVTLMNQITEALATEVPDPLINGNDLLQVGIPEGKRIGKILQKVRELQLEGKITTAEQALKTAKGIA